MNFVPSEDSDQPRHPLSLIRVFDVRSVGSLGGQRRRWSNWADAQVVLSLRWAHSHLVAFAMPCLNFHIETTLETIGTVTNLHMRN